MKYSEQFVLSTGITTDGQIAISDRVDEFSTFLRTLSLVIISRSENFRRFGSKRDVKKLTVVCKCAMHLANALTDNTSRLPSSMSALACI